MAKHLPLQIVRTGLELYCMMLTVDAAKRGPCLYSDRVISNGTEWRPENDDAAVGRIDNDVVLDQT
jgi:hypothetical protein